ISVSYDSSDTAALAIEKGEIDFLYNPQGESLQRLMKVQNLVMLVSPGASTQALQFNTAHATMKDKRVRQALIYAIDRPTIINGIVPGRAALTDSLFAPSNPQWIDANIKKYPYDVE